MNLSFDPKDNLLMFDNLESHFRNISAISLKDTSFVNLIAVPEWDERDITSTSNGDSSIQLIDQVYIIFIT